MSFEFSGRLYNPSQNTVTLMNEFEKCILSFMESLIADFIQLSNAIVIFLILQGRLGTMCDYVCTQCCYFTKISSFCKSFDSWLGNSYIQFDNDLILLHLR